MRPSRVFRLLFRIFILLLTLSLTVVTTLGLLSAVSILSNHTENFQPDFGNSEFNLEINMTTGTVENVNFSLPFNITNAGYFDLENLEVGIKIALNYSHIDYPAPGINETRIVQILNSSQNFGTILQGTKGSLVIAATNGTFNHSNFPNYLTEVNMFHGPPVLEFYANITICLDYTLGLHSLSITFLDYLIGAYP